ncbi:MAG: hypothetical protein LBM64_07470 [Deltaproteobacteria bacterium]|jgi:hypothetical protein|nr:hypothetical protein [Deltaproteobacteria bacterium]
MTDSGKTREKARQAKAAPKADFGACAQDWQEEFSLPGYGDGNLSFTGRLFSEGSFFDEENGSLTRLRLFALDENRLIYSVVSGAGEDKDRRVYQLKVDKEFCQIDNGRQRLTLPVDMLFMAVFGICGLAPGQENEIRAALEESLGAVSA